MLDKAPYRGFEIHRESRFELHVIPNGDLYEHYLTDRCSCTPIVHMSDDYDLVFTHQAHDARELLEPEQLVLRTN